MAFAHKIFEKFLSVRSPCRPVPHRVWNQDMGDGVFGVPGPFIIKAVPLCPILCPLSVTTDSRRWHSSMVKIRC